ncbi:MAG: cofactor-independent phosphoglycerate mutase [Eubacteriales bacterium]
MKYLVVLEDGAADYKIPALGGKTPYDTADKPATDALAARSFCGMVENVPAHMVPESDTANLAVMSYDPAVFSKGRSPLEAVSMGLEMSPAQTAFRCNVVTLGNADGTISYDIPYDEMTMLDHSADEITTAEAAQLIRAVDEKLGDKYRKFYPGISYRHCLLWENAPDFKDFTRPHDIIGKKVGGLLPPEPFLSLYRESREILKNHPVNLERQSRGLRPANSIWLWSPGKKPALPSFTDKWGLRASVISAVDLIKGIGLCAGMTSVDVEGATGNIHTNFTGKADAAIAEFKRGQQFVYIHVEAPDECGHRAELENKVKSIEYIDKKIVKPLYDYLVSTGEDFKIMILPDHPTPISLRTHSHEAVPFMIYSSADASGTKGVSKFCEDTCAAAGNYYDHGYDLLSRMIKNL